MLRIILLGLAVLTALSSVAYFTYFKTTPIGGERGIDPVWYSKNSFFIYISRRNSSGGFLSMEFVETSRIEDTDYASFEYIGDGFAKDKNYFYYPSSVTGINSANGIEYSILKAGKIENNPNKPLKIVSVDVSTNTFQHEKYYIINDIVFRAIKERSVSIFRLGLIASSNQEGHSFDYETFKPFHCGYAKDKNGVYYNGFNPLLIIEDADIDSFNVTVDSNLPRKNQEGCIATDKNYQYFYSKGKNDVFEIGRKPLDNTVDIK